ncbi:unnamed protein product [Paramecium sonneborni]|uniref:Secreted protein n=1 Tax=Paramecium sonneborni TaxID=65129 RepID=A0A8S1Q467_9CILI|nr:unnamed protein product [Paramecium sonneborni]
MTHFAFNVSLIAKILVLHAIMESVINVIKDGFQILLKEFVIQHKEINKQQEINNVMIATKLNKMDVFYLNFNARIFVNHVQWDYV